MEYVLFQNSKIQYDIYYNSKYTLFPIFDGKLDLEQKKKLFYDNDISKIYFKHISKYTIKYIKENLSFFKNEFGNNYLKLKQILKKYNIPIDIFLKNRIDFNTFLFLNDTHFKELGFLKGPTVVMKEIIKKHKHDYDYIKSRLQ